MTFTRLALWIFLAGVLVLKCEVSCLRGSALVAELKAKAKASLLNPVEVVEVDVEDAVNGTVSNSTEVANKTRSLLTGNPQKDYIYDPNLPRELNGYNLSSYPFYNGVPEDIDFKCDDLHDGFYASVPHKCQVYHHCLFGTRYDFLCANYTAFDQKTFICHFVSEVDCDNSPKYFQRNEALYKSASTTSAPIPQTPRQTTPPPPTTTAQAPPQRPRRRRPYRRRRPVYEYYYDDESEEDYYYDDPPPPRRKMNRKHRPQGRYRDEEDDYYDGRRDSSSGESSRPESSRGEGSRGDSSRGESRSSSLGDSSKDAKATLRISGPAAGTVYDRPRVPPKIRRPVPVHERDKYDYTPKLVEGMSPPSQTSKKGKQQPEDDDDEYYDEEYDDEYVKPPSKRGKTSNDPSMESVSKGESRRANNHQRPRQHSRRRPDHYDDEYEDDRPIRPRKRPQHEETTRGNRGSYRGNSRDEPDPVPADRPGFISSGRFSSSNRKRAEDDRVQMASKKQQSRIVYDDEEEYYDDEEEDIDEDETNRRNSQHSSKGRWSDDYDHDRRKPNNPSRKQNNEFKPNNQPSRTENRPSTNERSQGGFLRSENRKLSSKQKPEESSFRRDSKEEPCKNNCEDDYSDELSTSFKQNQRKSNSQDSNVKEASEQYTQSQVSERDRLFSSRFRDNLNESKTKQQGYEPISRTSTTPPTIRTTTQTPELSQKYKPSLRMKPVSEETPINAKSTTSTSISSEDYSDESFIPKYNNFRSKARPSNPVVNNFKSASNEQKFEITEQPDTTESEPKLVASIESEYSTTDKFSYSPRPFSGIARRPLKQYTEPAVVDELAVTPSTFDTKTRGFAKPNRQQFSTMDEDDEKSIRKFANSGQIYRRIKTESPQIENTDYSQLKILQAGNNLRRPNTPEETTLEEPDSKEPSEDTSTIGVQKGVKSSAPDKSLPSNPYNNGAYRRIKVSAISTPVTGIDVSSAEHEITQPLDEISITNPVNSNKRPYVVMRPLNSNPVVVDENSRNVPSPNIALKRPSKQRIQESEPPPVSEDNSYPSVTEGIIDNYRKPDPNLGSVSLRQNYGFFPPKRGKIRIDDSSERGLEQYPKQLTLNKEDQYAKQLPKVDITAPGPSAPGREIATVKSNYNSGTAGFSLNIPEEEYDVTLNDALQPSTLHPTRSLVDYQQTQLKSRDFQPSPGRNSEYVNRGRVSYLLPAASQQVQSVFIPEAAKERNKDPEEYEAVVFTAPGDQWTNQRRNRPTEWYW